MGTEMARGMSATVEAYEDEEPMTVGEALDVVFRKYATFGRSKLQAEREQDYLSSSSLLKLMKDCHLIDRALTITDLDLIFTRCLPQKYHKRLDTEGFHAALFDVAVQRQMPLEDLLAIVAKARPSNNGGSVPDAYVKFHDDRTTWTGVATRGGPTIHDRHQHAYFGLSSIWDRDPNYDVRGVKPQLYQGEQQYSYHYRPSAFADKSPKMYVRNTAPPRTTHKNAYFVIHGSQPHAATPQLLRLLYRERRFHDDDKTQVTMVLNSEGPGGGASITADDMTLSQDTIQPVNQSAFLRVLTDYFAKHNPSKIEGAARLLAKYAGREMELFDKIFTKYGEPVLPLQAYAHNQRVNSPQAQPHGALPFNPLGSGEEGRQPRRSSPNARGSGNSAHQSPVSLGSLSPTKSPNGARRGQPAIFDKLQDHSQYTGAHKHRFDSSGQVGRFVSRLSSPAPHLIVLILISAAPATSCYYYQGRGLQGRDAVAIGVGTHAVGRTDFQYGAPMSKKPEYTGSTNQGTDTKYIDASEFLTRR